MVFIVIGSVYWQGTNGLFLLDDVANLQLLADKIQQEGFWEGILGGHSGPTGRPISLLSFAIQLESWPDSPSNFKQINVAIHLGNSLLIFAIVYRLTPHLYENIGHSRFYLAVFLSAFWALLPIQISTVLYTIQRMVLLSTLFMLGAILFYLWARIEIQKQNLLRAAIILILGVGGCSLAAVFSKESGLLVFAFILATEYLLSQKDPIQNVQIRLSLRLCIWFPLVMFAFYVVQYGHYNHYEGRTFSLTERVLTQPRVLLDYVQQTVLPVQSMLGVYHDDYTKSTSLFEPISTLWAVIVWGAVTCLVILRGRRNKPWVVFSFWWFVSGHLMESTVLPLELYFEHRNYLSSLGVLVALTGVSLLMVKKIKSDFIMNITLIGFVGYLALIFSLSYSQISLWGTRAEYMIVSARENPGSLRARMLMIDYYHNVGEQQKAFDEIQTISQDFPNELAISLSKLYYACDNGIKISDISIPNEKLQFGRFSNATETTLLKIIDLKRDDKCQKISFEYIGQLVDQIRLNTNYSHASDRLLRIKIIVHFELKEYADAIKLADGLKYRDFSDDMGLVTLYILNKNIEKAVVLFDRISSKKSLKKYQVKQLNELGFELKKYRSEGKND